MSGLTRLRLALHEHRPRRWARRLLEVLPPEWHRGIYDWNEPIILTAFNSMLGLDTGPHRAVVYALGSHSALYLGKAILRDGLDDEAAVPC